MTIKLTINRKVQSANAFVNRRGFGGTNAYKKDRDAWRILLRAALTPRNPPKSMVRVDVLSYRNRELDHANLVGGCKGLVDELKRLGLIYDDAPKYFEGTYRQAKVPRAEERTVITIIPNA